jgi:hypothetical protein
MSAFDDVLALTCFGTADAMMLTDLRIAKLLRQLATFFPSRAESAAAAKPAVSRRGRPHQRPSWLPFAMLILPAAGGMLGKASAQTPPPACTVSGGSVTLTAGSCSIAPNTTLTGTPAVHATTSAQITTNNVTINPFNGGSIGGLAETNGTITFSHGSSINGNWSTAALAQSGGRIIFQAGDAINPSFGGGITALLANGAPSQITATGFAVSLNGNGGDVGAKATGGGTITLDPGTSITYAAGGGGNTGIWATGSGSGIVANGTTLKMPGGGGGDIGVRADTGGAVALNGGAVTLSLGAVTLLGGGETGLFASAGSIAATGTTVTVSGDGGDVGAKALAGGTMNLASMTISVPGSAGGETGMLASGAGSSITGTAVTVSVPSSGGGRGVQADTGGRITLQQGSTISTGGANSPGAFLNNGGIISLTDSTVTTSGAGSFGFLFQGATNQLNISGTTVMSAADAFAVRGGTSNITATGSRIVGANGILLSVSQGGLATMAADSSLLVIPHCSRATRR